MWVVIAMMVGLTSNVALAKEKCASPTSQYSQGHYIGKDMETLRGFAMKQGIPNPMDMAKDEVEAKKTDAEQRAEDRLKAIEAMQGDNPARVVVLEWAGKDTDYSSEGLQRNVKARIARSNAKFFPEVDLYQEGRTQRELRAADQMGSVPPIMIDRIMRKVREVQAYSWNQLDYTEWLTLAAELRELAEEVWFVDRVELREPLFLLYTQIGRAVDESGYQSPPFFQSIHNQSENYYWYLAAGMAHRDPSLLSKLTDQDLNSSITNRKNYFDQGYYAPLVLSFENEGIWDIVQFNADYEVFINGLPLEDGVTSAKGLVEVPMGRADVYMARTDGGHSLSDRIELNKLDGKMYFVRDVARKIMGVEFQKQLMEFPNECVANVTGDIIKYLSVYAELHAGDEIYVAVPVNGSTSKVLLWRWEPISATLQKVQEGAGSFPVRFAALLGTGMTFNAATLDADPGELAQNFADDQTAGATSGTLDAGASADDAAADLEKALTPELAPAAVPIAYHLRGHWGRLMVTLGIEFAGNITEAGAWHELYQTDEHALTEQGSWACNDGSYDPSTGVVSCNQCAGGEFAAGALSDIISQEDANAAAAEDEQVAISYGECSGQVPITKERAFQRLIFVGIGVVLGKEAAIGIGPRGYLRVGWYDSPHAIDITGHVGYTGEVPGKERVGRVRPILDADAFAGIILPVPNSMYIQSGAHGHGEKTHTHANVGEPIPTFGITAMAGITF